MATTIEISPVSSTMIAGLGYDLTTRVLAVEWPDGHITHYQDVGPDVAQELHTAPSIGKAFHALIRGHGYVSLRMTGTCVACGDIGPHGERCTSCGVKDYDRDARAPRRQGARRAGWRWR
jgi:hypothetical protein